MASSKRLGGVEQQMGGMQQQIDRVEQRLDKMSQDDHDWRDWAELTMRWPETSGPPL